VHQRPALYCRAMILLIALLLAVFVVPMPWSVVIVFAGLAGDAAVLVWGRRIARRWRPRTGAEAMLGRTARVESACRPRGQVRIRGELWEATCSAGADRGETVRVEALDGLTLIVAPVRNAT
jgi:membrane-bound serine protease (ClpP class)